MEAVVNLMINFQKCDVFVFLMGYFSMGSNSFSVLSSLWNFFNPVAY